MKRITKEVYDRITLNASLQRLGVVELDERLEFSPLLVETGLREMEGDASGMCCVCKIADPVGDGSTGLVDGGLVL